MLSEPKTEGGGVGPVLEIRDLELQFSSERGKVSVLNGLNLTIEKGDSVGIVGETGCGKSVTALSVLRLLDTSGMTIKGKIVFNGVDLLGLGGGEMRKMRGSQISMVFQEPMSALNPVFTVGTQLVDVMRLHLRLSKEKAEAQAVELLSTVGFKEPQALLKKYPHELSGGMKQRILIAMALSCKPSLLIADEPTTALDVTTQARILKLLDELVKKFDLTLMLITHDIGIAAEICNKLAVMYVGRIVEYGDISEVIDNPAHPYTQALMRAIPSMEPGQSLVSISGSLPSPTALPAGCRFNPRCPKAMERCERVPPGPTMLSPTHMVECHLYGAGESSAD